MPISPEKMKLYPGGSTSSPEWLAIRERIRARAGNKCEDCGVPNGALGGRTGAGVFRKALPTSDSWLRLTWPRPGDLGWLDGYDLCRVKIIRIVCTVAHVDGGLTDHSDANLKFWCQRCHLRHDRKQHQHNASITRAEKAGQPDMFGRH